MLKYICNDAYFTIMLICIQTDAIYMLIMYCNHTSITVVDHAKINSSDQFLVITSELITIKK